MDLNAPVNTVRVRHGMRGFLVSILFENLRLLKAQCEIAGDYTSVIDLTVVISHPRSTSHHVSKAISFPTVTCKFVYATPNRWSPQVNTMVSDFIYIASGDSLQVFELTAIKSD